MLNKIGAILCLFCLNSVGGQSQLSELLAPFMSQIRTEVNNLYTRADLNGNGRFDLSDLSAIFGEYDTNNDGQVTRDEFVTRFAGNSSTLRTVAMGLFLDVDHDKNGALGQSDLTTYFNKIDQNDDGQVDKSEFVNFFTQLFEQLFLVQLILNNGGFSTTHAP